ncbi:MAG: small multi-drug export protein [Candidatus Aenigmatarchaeota archaeon]
MQESVVLLSMVPGIEAMWASSYFFYYNELIYIPLCVLLNFLSVLVFIKILDKGSLPKRVERFLERRKEKAMKRAEKWFQKYGNIVLFFLIALPLTGVGSYTGSFIGRVFDIKGKGFYLMLLGAISLSVVFGYLIGKIAGVFLLI